MSSSLVAAREAQAHAALGKLQNKKPAPAIDFTIHTMEDGTTASTIERYNKGIPHYPRIYNLFRALSPHFVYQLKGTPPFVKC
jgi:hypothetical protein